MTPDDAADKLAEAADRMDSVARHYKSRALRLKHSRLATHLRTIAVVMREATTEGVCPGDIPGTYRVRMPYP